MFPGVEQQRVTAVFDQRGEAPSLSVRTTRDVVVQDGQSRTLGCAGGRAGSRVGVGSALLAGDASCPATGIPPSTAHMTMAAPAAQSLRMLSPP